MKKTVRGYDAEQFYDYYINQNWTVKQIAEKFNLTESMVQKDARKYGIKKPKNLCIQAYGTLKHIDKNLLYHYYIEENFSIPECAKIFNVHEKTIKRRVKQFDFHKTIDKQQEAWLNTHIKKYGAIYAQSKSYNKEKKNKMLDKMHKTCVKKYGVPMYSQTIEFGKKRAQDYYYDNKWFDSSWELALYIYAKDHNEEIVRSPCRFSYIFNNVKYYYVPDFLYRGKLIEIKGSHLIDKNGNLVACFKTMSIEKLQNKQKCMIENNVHIWTEKDIQFALDYINKKYGKGYLRTFHRTVKKHKEC